MLPASSHGACDTCDSPASDFDLQATGPAGARHGLPWPPHSAWQRAWSWLPTQCLLCRGWQHHSVCRRCIARWQPDVPRCPRCAIGMPEGRTDVCQTCEDASPEFDRAITALDYTAPWSPLLARLKFHGATALARPLGDLLAAAVQPRRGRVSLLLPVPLSGERLAERGFNQSWLLAQRVAMRLNLRAHPGVVGRVRHTQRLMAMTAEERQQAIGDAFAIQADAAHLLRGRHVAVIDDVLTTGATLNAVSRVLLDAGARSVSAWVVARTPAPGTLEARAHQDGHQR
ncbi:MAG: ComF family protein [Aquabacterium sp.]